VVDLVELLTDYRERRALLADPESANTLDLLVCRTSDVITAADHLAEHLVVYLEGAKIGA
jgi:hypothetical protein